MADTAPPATPQRPMPGLFMATPAPARPAQPVRAPSNPPVPTFASNTQPQTSSTIAPPSQPTQQATSQQHTSASSNPGAVAPQNSAPPAALAPPSLTPIQRAARTINDTLSKEARYPELEQYASRVFTSIPPSSCTLFG
jgi:nuclear pore complex protein Nup155